MNGEIGCGERKLETYKLWHIFRDPGEFIYNLNKAIKGQAEAIKFYKELRNIAPNTFHKRQVEHALEDERKHYHILGSLYNHLTDRRVQPVDEIPVNIKSYREALKEAVEDELMAVELYRSMYLSTFDIAIRDLLFDIMNDEMEHADRLTLLYADLALL